MTGFRPSNLLVCSVFLAFSPICFVNASTTVDHPELNEDPLGLITIRLVGGSNGREGRVEIYQNREWGTVCDNGWDDVDASVVCRELGLPYTNAEAVGLAYFGKGTGSILKDNVRCIGWESRLALCKSRERHRINCTHVDDAGVRCKEDEFSSVETWEHFTASGVEPILELSAEPPPSKLFVFSEVEYIFELTTKPIPSEPTSIHAEQVLESTHEATPSEAFHITKHPEPNDVRLVGGSTSREGRVEIYHNGEWGTICDDAWDDVDARVVCRQLRLPYTNAQAFSSAYFGRGNGSILMDNVSCYGWESNLALCKSKGWYNHNCSHFDDASVQCPSGTKVKVSAELQCLSGGMIVRIHRSVLSEIVDDILSLDDNPNCTGVIDGDYIILQTGFDECGSTKEINGDFDIYRNRVVNRASSKALISREITEASYSITCYYERIHRLEYGYSVSGSPRVITKNLINDGDYDLSFDFSMYADDTFSRKFSRVAKDIPTGQRTYFAVEVDPQTETVEFQSCWTTPSNDSNDPMRYDLISSCWTAQSVRRHDLGVRYKAAFSLSSFTFIGGNEIYLYCSVVVCPETDALCDPCARTRRRVFREITRFKRSTNLSMGPFRPANSVNDRVDDTDFATGTELKDAERAGALMTAIVVMAIIIVGLVALVVALVKRNQTRT